MRKKATKGAKKETDMTNGTKLANAYFSAIGAFAINMNHLVPSNDGELSATRLTNSYIPKEAERTELAKLFKPVPSLRKCLLCLLTVVVYIACSLAHVWLCACFVVRSLARFLGSAILIQGGGIKMQKADKATYDTATNALYAEADQYADFLLLVCNFETGTCTNQT
jgi:hypothetical protein